MVKTGHSHLLSMQGIVVSSIKDTGSVFFFLKILLGMCLLYWVQWLYTLVLDGFANRPKAIVLSLELKKKYIEINLGRK